MIFHPDLAEKILTGEKTQTRRPTRNNGEPCRYVAGRDYAVQPGRGVFAVGRILVLSVELVTCYGINREDALAEGFASPEAFNDRWRQMYGTVSGWCWKIRFEIFVPEIEPA